MIYRRAYNDTSYGSRAQLSARTQLGVTEPRPGIARRLVNHRSWVFALVKNIYIKNVPAVPSRERTRHQNISWKLRETTHPARNTEKKLHSTFESNNLAFEKYHSAKLLHRFFYVGASLTRPKISTRGSVLAAFFRFGVSRSERNWIRAVEALQFRNVVVVVATWRWRKHKSTVVAGKGKHSYSNVL